MGRRAALSVTYNVNVRNSRLTAVVNAIDAGASNGVLTIGTTGMATVLATILLAKPSATVSGGVLTFSGLPRTDAAADNSGTAAAAQIADSNGTVVVSGLTVGTSGADIIISSVTITLGDIVSLVTATITGN